MQSTVANSMHPDEEHLLRNTIKTITNLREENRWLSNRVKNHTALLSTCIDVAHRQLLRI